MQGIDFAGKTGSAQTISNTLKAKHGRRAEEIQGQWLVRRRGAAEANPEIVVCALLEEGEHGYLAARLAAQVIKAYVDKQQRQPTKVAGSRHGNSKVEIGAVWSESGGDEDGERSTLQAGRFLMDVAHKRAPLAVAAPGLH